MNAGDFILRTEPFLGLENETRCRRALNLEEISVVFIRPEAAVDPDQRAALMALLCDEERRRMDRFHFEKDRTLFLIAHALLRVALSRYAEVPPREWRFKTGVHGRPEIASPESNLRFSLSHTSGLAACAINVDREIGFDVEDATRKVELSVAERYFSPREVRDLQSLPPDAQASRFLEYWTLKEAYLKAIGLGLAARLDGFSLYQEEPGQWKIEFAAAGDNPARWMFWSYQIGGHTTAVALATPRRRADK